LISFYIIGPNLNSPFTRSARETRIEAVIVFFVLSPIKFAFYEFLC